MTLKRERKYSDILDRIDYYLKLSDDWNSVDDLDDLIVAASSKFYFKDVSTRTISMFNVSGNLTHDYLSLQMPEGVVWDSAQEAVDTGQPFTVERDKTVEQFNRFTDELFPDGTETGSDTTEAGNSIVEALSSDGDYLDYSKDDIFPREGVLLHDDNAGAIRIQRADWKDPSKGYDVYRNTASQAGGNYSKVAPWSDDERVKLNDKPVQHYKNAYKSATDSLSAISGKKVKPQVSLGRGAKISRQQRRNLIQKVGKKLESREKAIKQGVRDRTRQRWKDNAQQFLIELPKNAQNAAGEGIRKLGEKALEAGDRLKEYEDMFTEQAGAKIREGVEKAKPEIRKALQAVRREAENQFFNAQDTWESAKQFAREKAPIIQGILQQAKVKGSPIWNAATKKGAVLTDKAMRTAGAGLARSQAAHVAVNGFMSRMKAEFKKGHREQMERMHGAMPSGAAYESNPQGYWEERANLATKYGKANAEFDRVFWNADLMEDPDKSLAAKKEGWAKFVAVRDEVAKGAENIGAKLENIQKHVQDIKDGSTTILPPAAGWPSTYGGASKVRSLQRNLKGAGLKPYKVAVPSALTAGGVPQAPLVDPAAAAPVAEAAPAEAAPEAAQDPKLMMEKLTALKARGEELGKDTAVVDQVMKIVQSELDRLNTLNTETPEVPAQPTAEQPYLPGMAPGAEPGAEQQIPMPGMGAKEGDQPVAGGPGPQISGKTNGAGTGAGIPTEFREYAVAAPKDSGIPLHQGEERGEGQIASFYDKREARKAAAAKQQDPDRQARGVGPMELQETNEMAAPMDDYKQAADEEESKAKRSQSKSKIRTARANARMAKARADEAEAKASRSEAESGAKIAHMLEKLDREIVELTAHTNPKVSSVLSRLEKAIDSKHKVPATKK